MVLDAYRTYAYFRWVDDTLDAESRSGLERSAFIQRQKSLLEACYRGDSPRGVTVEEGMLVELIRHDGEKNSGLQSYIRNMMSVMEFDAGRRGRLISGDELANYTRWLAVAVTEAMHYFIGHDCPSPRGEMRYLAVSAAHITHMLRDTLDDVKAGYFNIPREYLQAHGITPWDVESEVYRKWVKQRVQLARAYFKEGKDCLARVSNARCRMAGFAYTARFENVLNSIERDGYLLRPAYPERRSLRSTAGMGLSILSAAFNPPQQKKLPDILEFIKKDRSADFSPQGKAD
jgi:phytoene/squalene synthetase